MAPSIPQQVLAAWRCNMLNASTMIIMCPACASRYVVPDSAIGVEGRTVRCAKCRHSWFQEGPQLTAPPAPPPPPVPAPQPDPAPQQPAVPEPAPPPPAAAPAPPEQSWSAPPPPEPAPAPAEVEPEPAPPAPAWQEPVAEAEPPVEPPPPLRFNDETLPPPPGAGLPIGREEYEPGESRFRHEPLFRPRRNPAKMWMIAAVLFAVVSLGAVAAAAWYGLPSWMPFARPMFAEEQPGLKLDFPDKRQGQRQLPDQSWFFEANGAVTNISQASRSVPTILVVLRDARGRVVYTGEIHAPKRVLAPGESVAINEALVPVPKAAVRAEYGWKPGN